MDTLIIIFYILAATLFVGLVANIITTFKSHHEWIKLLRQATLKINDIKVKEIEYKHEK